ncbi:hypothetical protein KPL76_12830 [Subtercola sp. PAMC28395]|uniref:hypothetical protein n=1 Tax=Subtercola sp. PAMC28395 TaxID=2846775 RepID=UPI001C0D97E8|nr:hypothetical protein [Subtercola sp. PAMC28395]QWT23575.1 hypothetical protein KPL76_12830 [Subtercola sp. PAMC28395]
MFAITILISWGVTLVKDAFASPNPVIFGSVNITLFLAQFVELIVWVLLLASLRRNIANRLTSAGIKISSEPRILSPSRFLRWCLDQGFSREQAVAALSVTTTRP